MIAQRAASVFALSTGLLLGGALAGCAARAQPAAGPYDLLIKGGTVLDPANGIHGRRDVAIAAGKIAAVEEDIDPAAATRVIDAGGLYVTPGLVDMHVHVYAGTGQHALTGDVSVYPDDHGFRACTTTMVDAGTSGWRNFEDFKQRVIDRAKTRVLAFLNIVGRGMGGGEVEQDTEDMDPERAAEMASRHPDTIVGFKTAHYAGPGWTGVDRVIEAGRLAGLPVMVDFGEVVPSRPFEVLYLEKMRPGDIYTHVYRKVDPFLDENGEVRPYLFAARERGVIFDVGHGAGSFSWGHVVPAMEQGFWPDSISTDLHATSMNAGMKDIVNLMSKFLSLGMPLDDVIRRSTWNPAREIRREQRGHLTVGAPADVAVLALEHGRFGFVDSEKARMDGSERLTCELTLLGGKVMWDLNGRASDPWDQPAATDGE